ncbi:Wfdc1 [Columba guinea]|nr:Wfdc1 [Columba guinea]
MGHQHLDVQEMWEAGSCYLVFQLENIISMISTLLDPRKPSPFAIGSRTWRGKSRSDYEYPLHSHSSHYQKNDRCPPPPQTLPDRACEVPSCRSDSECERHKRCCYNGCIYACLESVQPPPVLDWLVQPKPRWLGGNGWLLDGPEEVLQAEACSTTEDGDEPLHCPTGYECHIINPGNTAEGIPNRGQCIKLRGNPDGRNLRHKYYKEYFGSNSNNVVGYVKNQQKHLG